MTDVVDIDLGFDKILETLEEISDEVSGKATRVGVVGEAAQEVAESGMTMADVAFLQEFGTSDGHVPERSFLRSSVDEREEAIVEKLRSVAEEIFDAKDVNLESRLGEIGASVATGVKAKISEGISPPLAESTALQTGATTPLERLADSIGHSESTESDDGILGEG